MTDIAKRDIAMRALVTSATLLLAASPVAAFTAVNGLNVQALPPAGQFEVISSLGAGPREIWCAGAQFAHFRQGAAGNTRLYIVKGLSQSATQPARKSVIFTTRPNAALAAGPKPGDDGNYSVSLKKTGFNLRVAHAEGFCETIIDDVLD